jgi:hypothetical protein
VRVREWSERCEIVSRTRTGGEGGGAGTTPLSLRSFSCVRPVVRDFASLAGLARILCDVRGAFSYFGGGAFGSDTLAIGGAFGRKLLGIAGEV